MEKQKEINQRSFSNFGFSSILLTFVIEIAPTPKVVEIAAIVSFIVTPLLYSIYYHFF